MLPEAQGSGSFPNRNRPRPSSSVFPTLHGFLDMARRIAQERVPSVPDMGLN